MIAISLTAAAGHEAMAPTSRVTLMPLGTSLKGQAALTRAKQAGIDLGAVIETVGHRVEPAQQRYGRLVSEDRLYRLEFDSVGFSLSLRRRVGGKVAAQAKARRDVMDTQPERARARRTFPAKAIPFERSPALEIETTRVLRGGMPLALSESPWRAERNSAQRELAPGLSERVTARDGELEWDFLLARPLGSGALKIEAEVDAAAGPKVTLAQKAEPRLLWAAGNGRSVAMGEMVVEDASGRKLYRALPEPSSRGISMTVPARVLRDAAYPLTIDPVISPEYPVADPATGSAFAWQSTSALAFDGANYLVVWTDGRATFGGYDVYGARVSPAGTILDGSGLAISTAVDNQSSPALAFDGTNYLVAWEDWRRSGGGGTPTDIYGARVSPAGSVLDPDGFPISAGTRHHSAAEVAFDGTNYLVAWTDTRSGTGTDIYGTRVSPAGSVLDPTGIAISTAVGDQSLPRLAFDGTKYLVTWWDSRSGTYDIFGARVSAAGSVLDPAGIAISTAPNGQYSPALAFDGTNYLVTWADFRSGTSDDIYGTRVSPAGSVLDPAGIAISTAGATQYSPAIGFDGTNYLVAWQDWRENPHGPDIYGARVSPGGGVLDSSGFAISSAANFQSSPALAFDGTNYLVAWTDGRSGGDNDVYGARVSPDGVALDDSGFVISTAAVQQGSPALGFDGTNYLVVWEDWRSGLDGYRIYGARVSPAGGILDGSGLAISAARATSPAIAFDGTNYLVTWTDHRSGPEDDVYGARVSPAGNVLDPAGIAISTAANYQYAPALAFDGTNYLVAWTDRRCSAQVCAYNVFGARVTQDGSVLDSSGIAISTGEGAIAPALAFDGTNYLVVWTTGQIYGRRVAQDGTVLDSSPIPIATPPTQLSSPAIAFDGTNYLVVWTDGRSGTSSDIYGGRVSPAGSVLDPGGIRISTTAGYASDPALAFDGASYLVAWRGFLSGAGSDVYGAGVSPGGTVFEPFGLANAGTNEGLPAVVRGDGNRVAAAYARFAPEPPYGAQRVFLRFVRLPPPPPDPPRAPPAPRQPLPRLPVNCRVPGIVGLRLATAKARIRRAGCRVGPIRRVRSRRVGRVIRQSPQRGAFRFHRGRVALVVGRRR